MADLPPYPDANGDTNVKPDHESPPGTPRWVKVSGIIVIVLILAFVILRLTGHGPVNHGPGGRIPSGEHAPPGGGH